MIDGDSYELHLGDCIRVMGSEIADRSIDAVICDPPYGTTACKWDSVIPFAPMWGELKRIMNPRGAIVLFGSQPFTSALIMSNPAMFKYEWIWDKQVGTDFANCNHRPLKSHETISVFAQGGCAYNPQKGLKAKPIDARNWKSEKNNPNGHNQFQGSKVIRKIYTDTYPRTIVPFCVSSGECNNTKRVHPTQKPVALMEYLIKTYTNEGETVLDFTMGSGTTGVAALKTGRRFIGIERDETYFEIAQRRLEEVVNPAQLAMAV